MSRADGIKITDTALSIFGEGHDPFYVMPESMRLEDGTYPSQIIVATSVPGGYTPRRVLLPHQLYTGDAQQMLADTGDRELWVLPVYDHTLWTQVDIERDGRPPQPRRDLPDSSSLRDALEHWAHVFEGEDDPSDAQERDAQLDLADAIRSYMNRLEPGAWS